MIAVFARLLPRQASSLHVIDNRQSWSSFHSMQFRLRTSRRLATLAALTASLTAAAVTASGASILDIPVNDIDGNATKLENYRGKVILIVNVASKCGFTSQYDGLEKLYRKHKDDGLVIAGFPCNQFLGQEPGSNEQIKAFCRSQYGVSFPMFAKIDVKGDQQHPLFTALTSESSPIPGKVTWNFNKFLIDRTGKLVARFGSTTKPTSKKLMAALDKALKSQP